MEEIDYINAKYNKQNAEHPRFLYKYRPFDAFAMDMLENNYVYLCPPKNLDDPSECDVEFLFQDFYDIEHGTLKMRTVDVILEIIRPYTAKQEDFDAFKRVVYRTCAPDGRVHANFLLETVPILEELAPGTDIAPVVNFLADFPQRLDDPQTKAAFEKQFALAYDAKKSMGICSLSQLKNDGKMWDIYADHSSGYCVEYDMQDYPNLYALLPVVYQDDRQTNIVVAMLSSLVGELIFGISNGQIATDRSAYIRLFLTKNTIWAYQKEWRLLGDANQKLPAPHIRSICLGKNMAEENKRKLITYCKNHNIVIEYQV